MNTTENSSQRERGTTHFYSMEVSYRKRKIRSNSLITLRICKGKREINTYILSFYERNIKNIVCIPMEKFKEAIIRVGLNLWLLPTGTRQACVNVNYVWIITNQLYCLYDSIENCVGKTIYRRHEKEPRDPKHLQVSNDNYKISVLCSLMLLYL